MLKNKLTAAHNSSEHIMQVNLTLAQWKAMILAIYPDVMFIVEDGSGEADVGATLALNGEDAYHDTVGLFNPAGGFCEVWNENTGEHTEYGVEE